MMRCYSTVQFTFENIARLYVDILAYLPWLFTPLYILFVVIYSNVVLLLETSVGSSFVNTTSCFHAEGIIFYGILGTKNI